MSQSLKAYTVPADYKDIFDYNYAIVNNIENDGLFHAYVQHLADSTNIQFEIILLELKRYILVSHEYFPWNIQRRLVHLLILPLFFVNVLNKICWKNKNSIKEIIVDVWYENSAETFYGRELVTRLSSNGRALVVDFQSVAEIDLKTFVMTIPKFVRALFHASSIMKACDIDLRRYTYSFYMNVMKGKTIGKYYSPELIISGNDNGMSVVKAKAAGADVLLIQNGLRGFIGDSCFKFADYYICMGTERILQARIDQGCLFRNYYSLGSLRLYNFLRQNKQVDWPLVYDVLWIGGWGLCSKNSHMNGYYLATDEHKAIRIFNELVEETGLRAAYFCKYAKETDDLRKLGLFNEKVTYIEIGSKNVYHAVAESAIVLSAWSTICHEAMALGKQVGFINLSGNKCINLVFKNLEIEYTGESNLSPADFIKGVRARKFDYKHYMKQSTSYADELIDIVDRTVKHGR